MSEDLGRKDVEALEKIISEQLKELGCDESHTATIANNSKNQIEAIVQFNAA